MSLPERRSNTRLDRAGTRLDSYGKPLPELAEAHMQVLFDHVTNQAQRHFLHALVEETCRAVLRRGWYGEVQIGFSVVDGILQPDIRAGLQRTWRAPRE